MLNNVLVFMSFTGLFVSNLKSKLVGWKKINKVVYFSVTAPLGHRGADSDQGILFDVRLMGQFVYLGYIFTMFKYENLKSTAKLLFYCIFCCKSEICLFWSTCLGLVLIIVIGVEHPVRMQ